MPSGKTQTTGPDVELVRGTSDIPLTSDGLAQADHVGRRLRDLGWRPTDQLFSSTLQRARQTAAAVSKHTGAPVQAVPNLQPWHLGALEGTPVSDAVPAMNYFMEKVPDEPVPGKGAQSLYPGESFNDFRWRTLPFVRQVMQSWDPNTRVGLVTHFRDLKLIKSWLAAGAPWNFDIAHTEMKKVDNAPASVHMLAPDVAAPAGWSLTDVDPASAKQLPNAIYLIRHGKTAWNGGDNRPATVPGSS